MKRTLIIPAAGAGARLGTALPKVLAAVNGRPMLGYLLDLYRSYVDTTVVVVSPTAEVAVRRACESYPNTFSIVVQPQPTGMLDAILLAKSAAADAERVWITWCDQVAIQPVTVQRLAQHDESHSATPAIFPTMLTESPYIHFVRDRAGTIREVLHRREADVMPDQGEGDMGLFSLSAEAYFKLLAGFAAHNLRGEQTGERNFLPFLPWLADHGGTFTFSGSDRMEMIGINTPEDLARVERYLSREH